MNHRLIHTDYHERKKKSSEKLMPKPRHTRLMANEFDEWRDHQYNFMYVINKIFLELFFCVFRICFLNSKFRQNCMRWCWLVLKPKSR